MVSIVSGLTTLAVSVMLAFSSVQAECTDIHLVVAPSANQPTGLGPDGQQFLTDLASALPTKTASCFLTSQQSTSNLVSDMAKHIVMYASSCPSTAYTIGGYSQSINVTTLTIGIKASLGAGRNPSANLLPRVKATVTFNCDGHAYCLRGSDDQGNVVNDNPFGILQ